MSLRETTVADIVDATRPPNTPVVHVVGQTDQRTTLETFQKELRIEGVGSYFLPLESSKALHLKVDIGVGNLLSEADLYYNWYHHSLQLEFVQDILQMQCGLSTTKRPVVDVSHIVRIVDTMKTRLQQQWKRKQKRTKVHDLRVRAIELQVLALVTRLDLSCRFERLQTQVWIYIFDRPTQTGIETNIPLDKMPHDRIAILEKNAEEFHKSLQERARRLAALEMRENAKRKHV
jgi:hypothetical protein